jgi:SSS family solute:Na+ symporter
MNHWDYLIVVSYFLVVIMIGGWYKQRNRTRDDFLLGGRQMRSMPVALSLFVSWFSVISYTAIPGEVAANGPMVYVGLLAAPLGLWFVGWKVIPRIWDMGWIPYSNATFKAQVCTSAYESISWTFDKTIARLASTLFLLMRVSWMAMIVHIASKIIVAPISVVLRPWCVAAVLVGVTVIYSLGGFRAVVVTDCMQAVIMFAGAIVVIVLVGQAEGGLRGVRWPTEWPTFWPAPSFISPWERASLLPAMLGALSLGICVKTGDQMNVQRFLSVPSVSQARRVLLGGFVFDLLLTGLLAFLGFVLLITKGGSDADVVLPRFVGSGLPVGVTGLVVAALLAAAMSSLSSGINACVSTVAVDWKTKSPISWTIPATVGLGIIVFILSQIIGLVEGNLFELCYKVVNLLATPLGGLVLTALFIPHARMRAVWLGCFACLGVVVWVTYFSGITFLLASPIGLGIQLLIGGLPWNRRYRT